MTPTSNLHPMLNIAIKAARSAGSVINRAALDIESVRISQKQVNDFVTEVDLKAEEIIIDTLLEAYPGHGIWGEETGRERGSKHSEFVWVIDPIDGTTNFIHGFPFYAVSIALMVKGRIEQAVVYDPVRNDLFSATKGRGTFLNDRRLRVSKRIALKDCIVSTGFGARPGDQMQQHFRMLGDVMGKVAAVRDPGAAALKLAYVAAGYTDGYFEAGLSPWDVAAGSLLVTEAGGLVGNFSGESEFLEQRECMAANPKIYGQMIGLLSGYSKFAGAAQKTALSAAVKADAVPPAAAHAPAAEAPKRRIVKKASAPPAADAPF